MPDESAIQRGLRHALSPAAWCREVLDWQPTPWQAWLLENPAQEILILASRQAGKSSTCAALALWTATLHPTALVLVLAPAGRQSSELLSKTREFLTRLPPVDQREEGGTGVETASVLSIRFKNGSRIISLPGATETTIRGFSNPNLLIIDESGDFPDQTYLAIRPTMARGNTKFIAIGTPKGRRGWFHDAFESEDADFAKLKITAPELDYITPKRLEAERRKMGDRAYRQEYLCEWISGDEALFDEDDVRAAIMPEFHALKIYIGL